MTDIDGNLTTIERDGAGNPSAIVGPYGQRTTLTVDGNGYLASIEDPAGGAQALARTGTNTDYTVTRTTTEGRTTSYGVSDVVTGGLRRTVTGPEGPTTTSVAGLDGKTTTTGPDGTVSTLVESPDPRYAMQAPVLKSLTVRAPSGLTSSVTGQRAVGFGAGNPLGPKLVRN